ncbi:MAG: methyltransferase domain-containing protein [Rhodothermales bacterium]|nr:methyltransferase domain-containing protein [Rhodothermales bacterium]
MPFSSKRAHAREMMDDPDCDPAMLKEALGEIATLNTFLGAHSIYKHRFLPLVESAQGRATILDVGTGIGDIPVKIIQWSSARGIPVPSVTATDLRNDVLDTARQYAARHLSPEYLESLSFQEADLIKLPFADDAFDFVIAGQVLHHFPTDKIPTILREMDRVARVGFFVEDLHRHRIAYNSIHILSRLFGMSKMVQHDGPLSVNSGFTRREIADCLKKAGIESYRLQWHVTFRWSISNV